MAAELNLDNEWSIGESSFQIILDIISGMKDAARIVEFGSGRSSLRLAMALPNSNIISVESDKKFYDQNRDLVEQFGLRNLQIKHCPLGFQPYGPGRILSYEESGFFDGDDIHCVIVDGPAFYTLRGREACLYQTYSNLRIGGVIILDDYERKSEKIILENWQCVYPESFRVKIIDSGNQLAILRKKKSVEARWDHPFKLNDSNVADQKYAEIKAVMSRITDTDWIDWLETSGLAERGVDYYLHLLDEVRQAYGISRAEVEAVTAADAQLSPEEHKRSSRQRIKHCFQLFG